MYVTALIFMLGNVVSEHSFFEECVPFQDDDFRAPETFDDSWKVLYSEENREPGKGKKCGWQIDVFALGKLLQKVFSPATSLSIPDCLEKPLKRMISPDHRRRPTCASLLKCSWYPVSCGCA